MKKLFYFLIALISLGTVQAQESVNKLNLLSLSDGRYDELHEYRQFERVGSAIIDLETMKIVSFVDNDSRESKLGIDNSKTTRFLTIDPMAETFAFQSPYLYASNNPILFIDYNGESSFAPIQCHSIGMQQANLKKPMYTQAQINNTVRAEYTGYSVAAGIVGGLTPLDTYMDAASLVKNVATGNLGGAGLDVLSLVGLDFLKEGKKVVSNIIDISGSSKNVALGKKLGEDLKFLEKSSLFEVGGELKDEVIGKSEKIMNAVDLKNDKVKDALLDVGGDLHDWNKMSYKTGGKDGIDVHYYYNSKTNQTYYGADYKAKLGSEY